MDPTIAAARADVASTDGTAATASRWRDVLYERLRAHWRRLLLALIALLVAAAWLLPRAFAPAAVDGVVGSNGRLEAQPVDITAKSSGRIAELLVDEGDRVAAGQALARMDMRAELAQQREASAQGRQAERARQASDATVAQRHSALATSAALLAQRRSELDLAERNARRSAALAQAGAVSAQRAEEDQSSLESARAALDAADAQRGEALAGVRAAEAQRLEADAAIDAAAAQVERLQVQIDDGTLRAPRAGRIQYRVAQVGEVVAAGGKVLSLVDTGDVYMNVFLVQRDVDRLTVGDEARIVLDVAPDAPIPAHIAFISDVAQFTPKSVETADERAKLMFRVKVRVDPEFVARDAARLRSGAPGVAYVRVTQRAWPARLQPGAR